jgi:hypothetical protein
MADMILMKKRAAAWEADRENESAPLPYSEVSRYPNEAARQTDLRSAQSKNIASAAGELGLTSDEWTAMRKNLGRSPGRGDVQQRPDQRH